MTDDSIFSKIHQLKVDILLYQSSLETKNFVKLKETQLTYPGFPFESEATCVASNLCNSEQVYCFTFSLRKACKR